MKEVDDITQKLLLMLTTHIILFFLQIHLLKPNLCCIALSKQQEALVSLGTRIKQNSSLLIKMVPAHH